MIPSRILPGYLPVASSIQVPDSSAPDHATPLTALNSRLEYLTAFLCWMPLVFTNISQWVSLSLSLFWHHTALWDLSSLNRDESPPSAVKKHVVLTTGPPGILSNGSFFKQTLLSQQFRFTAKLRGRYRDFPYAFCPYMYLAPHCQYLSPQWLVDLL